MHPLPYGIERGLYRAFGRAVGSARDAPKSGTMVERVRSMPCSIPCLFEMLRCEILATSQLQLFADEESCYVR